MALNEKFRDADHLSLPVPAGKKSGDHVRVGGLNGVCQADRDADGNATVWLKGGHVFTTDFAVTSNLIGTDTTLKRFSPRSGAASAELARHTPKTTLVEHLRLAIDACDRYLARHPGTPQVTLVRDDLFRAYAKATA